jgi:hypothetical protein
LLFFSFLFVHYIIFFIILLSEKKKQANKIRTNGYSIHAWIENIQDLVDQEDEQRSLHPIFSLQQHKHKIELSQYQQSQNFFSTYRTYDEIYAYVQSLAALFPTLVTMVEKVGSSVEGRAIFGLRIFGGAQTTDSTPKVFFQGY